MSRKGKGCGGIFDNTNQALHTVLNFIMKTNSVKDYKAFVDELLEIMSAKKGKEMVLDTTEKINEIKQSLNIVLKMEKGDQKKNKMQNYFGERALELPQRKRYELMKDVDGAPLSIASAVVIKYMEEEHNSQKLIDFLDKEKDFHIIFDISTLLLDHKEGFSVMKAYLDTIPTIYENLSSTFLENKARFMAKAHKDIVKKHLYGKDPLLFNLALRYADDDLQLNIFADLAHASEIRLDILELSNENPMYNDINPLTRLSFKELKRRFAYAMIKQLDILNEEQYQSTRAPETVAILEIITQDRFRYFAEKTMSYKKFEESVIHGDARTRPQALSTIFVAHIVDLLVQGNEKEAQNQIQYLLYSKTTITGALLRKEFKEYLPQVEPRIKEKLNKLLDLHELWFIGIRQ